MRQRSTSLIYLGMWDRAVTAAEDPVLLDVALGRAAPRPDGCAIADPEPGLALDRGGYIEIVGDAARKPG
jgi:hypothetical protein